MAVRHRVGGVGDIAIEGVCLRRGLEREPAAGLKVQPPLGRPLARRPRVPGAPLIGARLEGDGLGLPGLAPILQEMREPGREDAVLEVPGCGAPEVDGAQFVPRRAGPAAVIPRPHHERVDVPAVVRLEQLVDLQGAIEVFLVPPSRHGERGHRDAGEVRSGALPLPERVVVGVRHEVVPGGNLPVQVLGIDVGERPEIEVPLEGVVAVELERLLLLRRLHSCRVLEAVAQAERAVMVEVVAQEHVGGRCLRRRGFERRVRVEHRHEGEPAGIRYPEHSHAAVVVGDVREQPVYRVVRVGAFVDRLRVAPLAGRSEHDELALGRVAPADVLEREDVAVVRERPVIAAQRVAGVGDAVGRAREDDRQRPLRSLRHEDRGVQLDPVARRDHDLGQVEPRGGIGLLRREPSCKPGKDEEQQESHW